MKLFLYTVDIDDPQMNLDIKRVIDEQQDKQKHATNVKAQMTEWRMQDKDGFKQLVEYVIRAAQSASVLKYHRPFNPIIGSMWGIKYIGNDYAEAHDHYPATWSCAYYIDPPEDGPAIEFLDGEEWIAIKPKNGLLVMFEGNVLHRVQQKQFAGERYVVSSNLFHDFYGN